MVVPVTVAVPVARAESRFRDEVIVQKLTQKVREGGRVFAVVGRSHVVMQERALRSRLTSREGRHSASDDLDVVTIVIHGEEQHLAHGEESKQRMRQASAIQGGLRPPSDETD